MNIPDLIKNNTLLSFDEPRPGISPEGREIAVNMHLRIKARDAIAYTRATMPDACRGMTDRAVLADFICVNFAAPVEDL